MENSFWRTILAKVALRTEHPQITVPAMDLSKYLKMDPHLLVGLVNTELRNHSDSLEDLVKTHDLSEARLLKKLSEAGYEYRPEQKQFR